MSFSVDYNRSSIFKYQVLSHNYVDNLWLKTIPILLVVPYSFHFKFNFKELN